MPSSVISVMIYDPAAQVLQVMFRLTGETYQYRKVSMDEWLRFQSAPSKGTYLNREFKEKSFPFDHFARGEAPRMPHGCFRWPETPSRMLEFRRSDKNYS